MTSVEKTMEGMKKIKVSVEHTQNSSNGLEEGRMR